MAGPSFPFGRAAAHTAGRRMEVVRLGPHPRDETREFRVVAERCRGGQMPGDLRLGVARVDRRVADLVQPDGAELRAALQLGREMVEGGACLRRNGPEAQGTAEWVLGFEVLWFSLASNVVPPSHAIEIGVEIKMSGAQPKRQAGQSAQGVVVPPTRS